MRKRVATAVFSVSMTMVAAGLANAQDYPNRPVSIVTSAVGGGNDFLSRLIAQGISGPLGQPIIVDNRASGVIPGLVVSRSAADGYTVMVGGNGLWVGPFLRAAPYDVEIDFIPVSLLDRASQLVVVGPSVPVTSIKELMADAKARPGALNYASGLGTSSHLAAELFKYMTGVNIVRVPYKGGAQEINDLLAGAVHLSFTATPAATQNVKSGKLRALAHTGEQPSPLYPGLPTVAATVPGYRAEAFTAMFVPAKTPAAAIKRLNEVTVRFLRTPEAKERLLGIGSEAVGSSPEEFAALLKVEIAQWGKLIKAAGIKPD